MSDGNFNRALLPKSELSAGLRAGKAQMRAKAEKAFVEVMDEFLADKSEEIKRSMRERFMELLRK